MIDKVKNDSVSTTAPSNKRKVLSTNELDMIKKREAIAVEKQGAIKALYQQTKAYTSISSTTNFQDGEIRPLGFFYKYEVERGNTLTAYIYPKKVTNFSLKILDVTHPINDDPEVKTILNACVQHYYKFMLQSNLLYVYHNILSRVEAYPGVFVVQVKGGRQDDNVKHALSYEDYNIEHCSIFKNTKGELDVFVYATVNKQDAKEMYKFTFDTDDDDEEVQTIDVIFCEVLNENKLYDYIVYYKDQSFVIAADRKHKRIIAFVLNECAEDKPYGSGVFSSCLFNISEAQWDRNQVIKNTGELVNNVYIAPDGVTDSIFTKNPDFSNQQGGVLVKGMEEEKIEVLPKRDMVASLFAQERHRTQEFQRNIFTGTSAFSGRESKERQNETESRQLVMENNRRETVVVQKIITYLLEPIIYATLDVLAENDQLLPDKYVDKLPGITGEIFKKYADKNNSERKLCEDLVIPAIRGHLVQVVTKTPYKLSSATATDYLNINNLSQQSVAAGGLSIVPAEEMPYIYAEMAGIPVDHLKEPDVYVTEYNKEKTAANKARKQQENAAIAEQQRKQQMGGA